MAKPIIFSEEVENNIIKLSKDKSLQLDSNTWIKNSSKYNYSYNFSSLGRPIIQYPQDMIALQEIIWETKPDLIIETGIAHGGSLIQSASMLAMLDYCDSVEKGEVLNPKKTKRKVLGIDIDIRKHNKEAIEAHPLSHHIVMIEGSSIEQSVINKVLQFSQDYKRVLVCLDSNHTHEHVLAELQAYSHLTSLGSYCIVFDTIIEDMPEDMFPNRPWGKSDNPKTAVHQFLSDNDHFVIDESINNKLLITVAPDGYLKRIS